MACCQPFTYSPFSRSDRRYGISYNIPCGYCLNCRVDRRNQWEDRFNFEFSQFRTGAFVTLTYDNNHIYPNLVKTPDGLEATLNYNDIRKFINRLRCYIKYHKEIQGPLARPDFKYLCVGEYGEDGSVFDRPHYHILFAGLDFAFMKKVILKEWKNGFIDCLPILNGGVRYVLKYMDKQVMGNAAKEKYDYRGLARPKMHCTTGLGSGLFKLDVDTIRKNNMCYRGKHGLLRPVPAYFKNKLYTCGVKDNTNTIRLMKENRVCRGMSEFSLPFYKKMREFKSLMALNREHKLAAMARNDGIASYDYSIKDYTSYRDYVSFDDMKNILVS